MQKIAEQKIQAYGPRGLSISFPAIYASDNNLGRKDLVDIYRDSINGKDVLIIIPKGKFTADEKIGL